ncbi:MAG: hypothetical protein HY711_08900 [Candidatus Melainabacteria bacterium]|nr:hypothetical protein [Candidatus Melainabacteria bacterium]
MSAEFFVSIVVAMWLVSVIARDLQRIGGALERLAGSSEKIESLLKKMSEAPKP